MIEFNARGIVRLAAGSSFGPAQTSWYQFVWIDLGYAEALVEGESFFLQQYGCCLVRHGETHQYRWNRNGPTRQGYIHFQLDEDALPAHWPQPDEWPRSVHYRDDDIVLWLLRHAVALADQEKQGDENEQLRNQGQQALALALEAFIHGRHETIAPKGFRYSHQLLLALRDLLSEYWADGPRINVSVQELAQVLGTTPTHLTRVCQRYLGQSPHQVVLLLRLELGRELLAFTNTKIQEIAERCGFHNAFHFSRLMKQHYGESPKLLRKKYTEAGMIESLENVELRAMAQSFSH